MTRRTPDAGEVWRRYDGVETEIVARSADRSGPYVRVRAEGSNRLVRVGLEQFARAGRRSWTFVRRI